MTHPLFRKDIFVDYVDTFSNDHTLPLFANPRMAKSARSNVLSGCRIPEKRDKFAICLGEC